MSIWATSAPEVLIGSWEWGLHISIGLGISFVNAALVLWQFNGHLGLETPKTKSDVPRTIIVVAHFFWAVFHVGWHYGYRDLL